MGLMTWRTVGEGQGVKDLENLQTGSLNPGPAGIRKTTHRPQAQNTSLAVSTPPEGGRYGEKRRTTLEGRPSVYVLEASLCDASAVLHVLQFVA